ncbi:MAG: cation:proton antiporter [Verrucomicrobiota bacterium]
MPESISFIQDLAVIAAVAGIAGWLCRKVGLSVVVGYLLAGVLIGPSTDPISFVTDQDRVRLLSELGLVFLMFTIGLGSGLKRMRSLGVQAILATALGAAGVLLAARALGLGVGDLLFAETGLVDRGPSALFFAAMFVASSSAIIGKVLGEVNALHKPYGQRAMGVTVLEDFVAVVMLTVLSSYTVVGAERHSVGLQLLLFVTFVVFIIIIGMLVVPRLLRQLDRSAEGEIGTLMIVGLVLLLALLAVRAGYSLALGAFILGMLIGDTPQKPQVDRIFLGLRDLFSAVFFVAIGMLIDVRLLVDVWPLILVLTAFTLVARTVCCTLAQTVAGQSPREALQTGLCVTPLGEFTFIIVVLGNDSGYLPESFLPIAVGISILTAFASPFLIRYAEPISDAVVGRVPSKLLRAVDFYHEMCERLVLRHAGNALWRLTKGRILQVAMTAFVVSGLFVFSEDIFEYLKGRFQMTGEPGKQFTLLFWSVLGLVAAGPIIAIWRNLSALCLIYGQVLAGGFKGEAVLSKILERVFQVFSAVAMALWLGLVLPLEEFSPAVLVILLALIIASIALLWRRLISLQSQVEFSVQEQLKEAEEESLARHLDWTEHAKWDLELGDLEISESCAAAGQSLRELDLRARCGVNVVGIDRGGIYIPGPGANRQLYPNDQVLLVGNHEQIEQARDILLAPAEDTGTSRIETTELDRLRVPKRSPCLGQTLAQLGIGQRFGVMIIGIKRGEERILNPGPEESLQAGDILLLAGTELQVAELVEWLIPLEDAALGSSNVCPSED